MLKITLIAAIALAVGPAAAHTGAGPVTSFASGVAHPLFGADHLLAMVLVGLWAALAGGSRRWLWPLAFVAAMVAGGALGVAGIDGPAIELAIAGSVVVLGLAVAGAVAVPVAAGAVLIGAFGLAHGHAHGTEAAGAGYATYAAGFVLTTALLHAAGVFGAGLIGPRLTRIAGAIAALAGLGMVLA